MSAAISATPPVRPVGRRCRRERRGRRRAARSTCSTASMPSTAWAATSRVSRPATIIWRRRAGCSASRPTSRFPTPSPARRPSPRLRPARRAMRSRSSFPARCAAVSAMRQILGRPIGCSTPPAASPAASTSSPARQIAGTAGRRHRGAGPSGEFVRGAARRRCRRRRRRARAAVELDGAARISVHRLRQPQRHVPGRRAAFQLGSQRQRIALRPQLQAQRRSELGQCRHRAAGAGVRQFRRPRPDHLSQSICLPVPQSLFRPEQPRAQPGPRNLGRHGVSRHAAVAGRRALGQSGNRSGLWPELDARRRRIPERRGLQGRRRGALRAHPALLRPPDHRSRRRHAKGGWRGQPIQRLANGEPAGVHRRQVRRHRHFRHQQIRPRSAQRLHELGADRHRHLRLRRRRLGFYLRRRRRVVPGRLDRARRHIRSVGGAQRHRARPAFRAVPMGRRDRAPL